MTLRPYSATLQKAYRDTLGTPGAPEVIDDGVPVMPVAIVATSASGSSVSISDGTDTLLVNTDGSINVVSSSTSVTQVGYANDMAGTAAAAATLYTPTLDFYCTAITIAIQGGTTKGFDVRDGGAAGTLKMSGLTGGADQGSFRMTFPTPVKFSTDVYLTFTSSSTFHVTLVGYEA